MNDFAEMDKFDVFVLIIKNLERLLIEKLCNFIAILDFKRPFIDSHLLHKNMSYGLIFNPMINQWRIEDFPDKNSLV